MISLTEAKAQLLVTHDDDDTYIRSLIDVVNLMVENFTNRTVEIVEKVEDFDGFSTPLVLGFAPLYEITSIQYQDSDDVQQTLASYTLDTRPTYAEITPAYGEDWPTTHAKIKSVTVTYQAGYTDTPEPLKQAGLMLLSSLYEQREDHIVGQSIAEVPVGAKSLMTPYRIHVL